MRKSGIALGIALCLLSGSAFSQSSSLKMGNYIIPSVFATALEEGMTIPVYLRYNLSNQSVLEEQSRNKIADALVVLKDNKITINSVTPTLDEGDAQVASINKQLLQSLNELKDKPFDQNNKIVLSSDATLNFDLSTFIMSLDVNEAGLATQIKARSEMLGKSTVDNISSVTTYDLGVYNNQMKQQKDNTNSYFSIDSIWSFAENHLNLSATAYGLGTAEQSFDFYRAMFERDFNGRRFAFGLLNTWNLQWNLSQTWGDFSCASWGTFLDELPEFNRSVLEVLREPLESGIIHVSRAMQQVEFPAKFQLLSAMNPCPCGYYGDPVHECTCTDFAISRYRGRVSGRMLDRIDLHVEVPRITTEELQSTAEGESSSTIRERVDKARAMQMVRRGKTNADLSVKEIEKDCALGEAETKLLEMAQKRLNFSPRSYHRILRVARTIADLDGSETINNRHLTESLAFRALDRGYQNSTN